MNDIANGHDERTAIIMGASMAGLWTARVLTGQPRT
jgi:hypothetical protein